MQRNYKLIVSIIALTVSSLGAFAQSEVVFRDVVLDGKPAKLNVATGEITLVKPKVEDKVEKSTRLNPEVVTSVSEYHIVMDNETLLDISKQYGVSLTDLKKANNLETTLIDKGQKLKVTNLELPNVEASDYQSQSNLGNASNFHFVEKGETLYGLAKRYNLELQRLKNLNDLDSNTIKIGQKLRVKSFDAYKASGNSSIWTVSKGDTLYSIAKQNGITIVFLKELNNLTSNTIFVGQQLQIK